MKKIQILIVILFMTILILPVAYFDFTPNAISLIDNRKLAENPFQTEGDLTRNIERYVNDRIGFRDKMIKSYTVLNDTVFGKMVHPSYSYGKDGYVFGVGITTSNDFGDYHICFADMVEEIQKYCEERDVPFLFVFNPAKPSVYEDKIADGINYNREWVDLFFSELDKRNVNYLDNTVTLKELREAGIDGFNQKYDANHWNDTGAFYSTQKILECLNDITKTVHVNEITEFVASKEHKYSLLVSNFPIDEYVPSYKASVKVDDLSEKYSAINLHPSYNCFGYYVNETRKDEGAPKALIFQGSYMNGHGSKYMANSFGEYIYVHDYQNVIDFPYYFNIFQPECVVFEVAEYTVSDGYFSWDAMREIDYNPAVDSVDASLVSHVKVDDEDIVIEKGDTLSVVTWKATEEFDYVWVKLDKSYDMKKSDDGYQVTVETKRLNAEEEIEIFVSEESM